MHRAFVATLQSLRSYPSVSLLVPTTPGSTLAFDDVERVHALVARADRRLRGDVPDAVRHQVIDRLHDLATEAASRPVQRGLALFASPSIAESVVLAGPVRPRVVIDETFATRDLVVELHRTVRFAVAIVSERHLAVLAGDPLEVVGWTAGSGSDDAPVPVAEREPDEAAATWLRRAARNVDGLVGPTGRPLVLAGVDRTVATVASHLATPVVGTVAGNHDRSPSDDLHRRAWPIIERWLADQEQAALAQLEQARSARRYAGGIDETWTLAEDGRVALLLAERGFEYPARAAVHGLVPADDAEEPGVIDDAVDELIEAVLARGGDALLVPDGSLADCGRVAAVLRY